MVPVKGRAGMIRPSHLIHDLCRILQIAWVVFVHGVWNGPVRVVRWRPGTVPPEVRLRLALETLAGTFLKLGQFLAMRYDILPPEYCRELGRLFGDVPPFPSDEAARIIESELGRPPAEIFASFERDPIAAASFGQVHRATLRTGERVAVKVQRPGIVPIVESDIRCLGLLARVSGRLGLLGNFDARPALDEFTRWTREELDFTREASHAELLADNGRGGTFEVYPRVYWEYTRRRVLTTEFFEGRTIHQLIALADAQGDGALRALGVDLRVAARNLITNAARQLFVTGFFHADPHPANMFVMPGGAIGYVDFGITGRLEPAARRTFAEYVVSSARGEMEKAMDALLTMVTFGPTTDPTAFRSDLRADLWRWYRSSRDGARSSVAGITFQILGIFRRHRIAFPTDVISFYKTMMTVDSIATRIAPEIQTVEVIREYFETREWQRIAEQIFRPESWLALWFRYGQLVRDLPRAVEGLARAPATEPAPPGPARPADPAVRTRALVLGMLVLALSILLSSWTGELGGIPTTWLKAGLFAGLSLWTLRVLGRLP